MSENLSLPNEVAFRDFDEFLEEPKSIGFKYRGKKYSVSAEMPMPVLLKATQIKFDSKNPGEGLGELGSLLELMLGKQNWKDLTEPEVGDPIGINAAQSILEYIMDEVSKHMAGQDQELPEDPPTAATALPAQNGSPSPLPTTPDTGAQSGETSVDFSVSTIPN